MVRIFFQPGRGYEDCRNFVGFGRAQWVGALQRAGRGVARISGTRGNRRVDQDSGGGGRHCWK